MDLYSDIKENYSGRDILARSKGLLDRYESTDSFYQLYSSFRKSFPEVNPEGANALDFRRFFNQLLLHYCHNEAYIKSTFIKKELLQGKHVTIFELPVGDSRADLCKINGHSICYEIKTDYDTTKRLQKQLRDYSTVFEYVYVISSEKRSSKILPLLPEHVGLYVYCDNTRNVSYHKLKEATLSPFLSSKKQLSCLSQSELQRIAGSKAKKKDIIQLLLKKDGSEINLVFKQAIKERYSKKWLSFSDHINDYRELDYQFFYQSMYPASILS